MSMINIIPGIDPGIFFIHRFVLDKIKMWIITSYGQFILFIIHPIHTGGVTVANWQSVTNGFVCICSLFFICNYMVNDILPHDKKEFAAQIIIREDTLPKYSMEAVWFTSEALSHPCRGKMIQTKVRTNTPLAP